MHYFALLYSKHEIEVQRVNSAAYYESMLFMHYDITDFPKYRSSCDVPVKSGVEAGDAGGSGNDAGDGDGSSNKDESDSAIEMSKQL